MTITPVILSQLPLAKIDAVIFHKRDEITTDLICCDVKVAGQVWTFHEEETGWSDLVTHLSARYRASVPTGMRPSQARRSPQARPLHSNGDDRPLSDIQLSWYDAGPTGESEMDKPVRAMWFALYVLTLLGMVSVILFLALGFHFFWLLQLSGVLTGGWAFTGAMIGLVRGRRIASAL